MNTQTITVWAAQISEAPKIGEKIKNPLGWLADEFGGALDGYGPLPAAGEIVEIGAYQDGGWRIAVECEVPDAIADAITEKDMV